MAFFTSGDDGDVTRKGPDVVSRWLKRRPNHGSFSGDPGDPIPDDADGSHVLPRFVSGDGGNSGDLPSGHYWVMSMRMTNVLLGIRGGEGGPREKPISRADIYGANFCDALANAELTTLYYTYTYVLVVGT